ncbi:NADH:ubiquinone oxidoreductase subunit M [Luteitalea sp. TBR-22]|uniref:NADH-quinone oxidoreductase subunit M n=1 Tax=Luteitalea sp. TBR-22 TaxID=2802971 RepID=UPI001AF187E4|nr:NADH-quinone oxidoreductase subunit M [Luteitalea sp. TBR-22]BCS34661.1 NADH:ubiquinone oxidoreductase subunit M [Luteitalea sp. TBR-22]
MTFPLLTLTVFAPLIGALLLLALPNKDGERNGLVRNVALAISLVVFVLTLAVWRAFDPVSADFQLVERVAWIPAFGIDYHLGVDGISLWLVVLTGFLTPLALLSSWHGVEKKVKEFSFFILALETGMLGVFLSLDLFLFYIFWDAMLIPMYFLIGIWGYDQRVYAAVKFILYTMAGSVLMLIAIIGLAVIHAQATGQYSFNVLQLYQLSLDPRTQLWFFLAFALAFAIKVPLFPFHTWLPDAHVQAPTAGSVILAGVLLKMGTYGLIRFAFPLFPDAALQVAPWIGTLAVIGIVYGALVAMVQPDMKKLVAYSSVSHMGVIVLGICAANVQGLEGAIYQMLNHGISTGGLFLIVGMLSDRRHTRQIAEYGGLKHVTPKLVAAFLIVTLSSIGMPGLNGFIGEFLSLLGGYRWRPALAAVAATGVILSAVYMLWMFQRVNYGPLTNPKNKDLHDLEPREWAALGPILVLAIVMGVFPNVFLAPMAPSVDRLVQRLHAQRPALAGAVPLTTPRPVPAASGPLAERSLPSVISEQAAR